MGLIRKWDIDNKQLEDTCVNEIIARIEELDGEQPGVIVAQDIIEIVANHYGPEVYNKAIREVKDTLSNRFEDSLIDIDSMQIHP